MSNGMDTGRTVRVDGRQPEPTRDNLRCPAKEAPTEIQPRMRAIVEWLNKRGFCTTDSGDGVTNVEAGMEGAMDYPHVAIWCRDSSEREARRLYNCLREESYTAQPQGIGDVWIQGTYDPADESKLVMLGGPALLDFKPRNIRA